MVCLKLHMTVIIIIEIHQQHQFSQFNILSHLQFIIVNNFPFQYKSAKLSDDTTFLLIERHLNIVRVFNPTNLTCIHNQARSTQTTTIILHVINKL